jgi:hypothetical protein
MVEIWMKSVACGEPRGHPMQGCTLKLASGAHFQRYLGVESCAGRTTCLAFRLAGAASVAAGQSEQV